MKALTLLRKYPRYLLFGFLHFFCSSVGQTYFVGLFVAGVTASQGWAEDTFAALYSGATLVAAFSLPVVGTQLDRRSVRTVSSITVVLISGALVVLGTTSNMVLFAIALYFARLGGQGVLPLIGSTTIGRFFQEGRGKALALTNVGKSVAEVAVPPIVVAAMAMYGYAMVWYGAASLLMLLFLPASWLLIRRGDLFQKAARVAAAQAKGSIVQQQRSQSRSEAFRDPRLLLILPAYMLAPFVITGMVFNQSVIAELRVYTMAWMALGLSSYGIARSICVLIGGPVIDRWGAERVLLFIHLPLLLGLVLFLLIDHRMSVPIFFVFLRHRDGSRISTVAVFVGRAIRTTLPRQYKKCYSGLHGVEHSHFSNTVHLGLWAFNGSNALVSGCIWVLAIGLVWLQYQKDGVQAQNTVDTE